MALLSSCHVEERSAGTIVAADGNADLVEISPGIDVVADSDLPMFFADDYCISLRPISASRIRTAALLSPGSPSGGGGASIMSPGDPDRVEGSMQLSGARVVLRAQLSGVRAFAARFANMSMP